MSYDRNAGGFENPLQRFDRLFFCRSFHSKLFPVGGLCLEQDRRVAPIVLPGSSRDTSSLDTSGMTTFRKPALSPQFPGTRCRGSNQIRWRRRMAAVTKSGFHPSVQEIKRGSPEGERCTCSLGQDRSLQVPRRGFEGLCSFLLIKQRLAIPLSSNPSRMIDGEWSPICLIFRKTNTDVPTTASTPGKECLTSLNGLAKGILAFGSIFRAIPHPSRPAQATG